VPNYTFSTLSQAQAVLAARLYDPTYQQWTAAELTGYIQESLRNWNALATVWRAPMTFSLTQGVQWYQLRTQSGTIIPYTVSQISIIEQIENHLLEPNTSSYPLSWSGSAQFGIQDLLSACQAKQDEILGVTGCTLTESLVSASVSSVKTLLPDTTLTIRRVAWIPGSIYTAKPLKQSDMFTERAFNPGYATEGSAPPSVWMQNSEPPPSFDVDTIPDVTGNYDVLTANSGPAWSASSGSLLTIPDDWTWLIKWGALFDILSRESLAKDELRAEYSKRRYEEGLKYLAAAPTVLSVRINNAPIATDSVYDADAFNPVWQSGPQTHPQQSYVAGDLMAFAGPPDAGSYSVEAWVVQNAPVPSSGGDYLQVARDTFDTIIDYAQHLAMVKSGGDEFAKTVPLYQKFQRKAALFNGKIKEMGFFEMPMADLSQLEEQRNPTYSKGSGPDKG
jgi:hypothetical protein